MIDVRVVRATFMDDGNPDTEARVLLEPDDTISFSINFGRGDKVLVTSLPGAQKLQLVEALQFVTDTIGAQIPGRLSPFVRGWISSASDLASNANRELNTEPPDDPEETAKELADIVAGIMAYAHTHGLPVAQLIEQMKDGK